MLIRLPAELDPRPAGPGRARRSATRPSAATPAWSSPVPTSSVYRRVDAPLGLAFVDIGRRRCDRLRSTAAAPSSTTERRRLRPLHCCSDRPRRAPGGGGIAAATHRRHAGARPGALRSLWQAMRSWRTASVSLMSFSSGMPLGLVWIAIPDWMRSIGHRHPRRRPDHPRAGALDLQVPLVAADGPLRAAAGWAGGAAGLPIAQVALLRRDAGARRASATIPTRRGCVGALALAIAFAVGDPGHRHRRLRRRRAAPRRAGRRRRARATPSTASAMYLAGSLSITLAGWWGWPAVNVVLALLYLPMLLVTWLVARAARSASPRRTTLQRGGLVPLPRLPRRATARSRSSPSSSSTSSPTTWRRRCSGPSWSTWATATSTAASRWPRSAWWPHSPAPSSAALLTTLAGPGPLALDLRLPADLLQRRLRPGGAAAGVEPAADVRRVRLRDASRTGLGTRRLLGAPAAHDAEALLGHAVRALLQPLRPAADHLRADRAASWSTPLGWDDLLLGHACSSASPACVMLARFVPWGAREPEFTVEAPRIRRAAVRRGAAVRGLSARGRVAPPARSSRPDGRRSRLQGDARGAASTSWPRCSRCCRPASPGAGSTLVGLLTFAVIVGLMTAAVVAARHGAAADPSSRPTPPAAPRLTRRRSRGPGPEAAGGRSVRLRRATSQSGARRGPANSSKARPGTLARNDPRWYGGCDRQTRTAREDPADEWLPARRNRPRPSAASAPSPPPRSSLLALGIGLGDRRLQVSSTRLSGARRRRRARRDRLVAIYTREGDDQPRRRHLRLDLRDWPSARAPSPPWPPPSRCPHGARHLGRHAETVTGMLVDRRTSSRRLGLAAAHGRLLAARGDGAVRARRWWCSVTVCGSVASAAGPSWAPRCRSTAAPSPSSASRRRDSAAPARMSPPISSCPWRCSRFMGVNLLDVARLGWRPRLARLAPGVTLEAPRPTSTRVGSGHRPRLSRTPTATAMALEAARLPRD